MAHFIHGFIARSRDAERFAAEIGGTAYALTDAFCFLPEKGALAGVEALDGAQALTVALAARGLAWSAAAPVVWLETEYFGGAGSQLALAWRDGRCVFDQRAVAIGAIDGALAAAFPEQGASFESLGLDRYRSIDAFTRA